MKWLPGSIVVFLVGIVVMWGYIGPRPATTFTTRDVVTAAAAFACVYAIGHSNGGTR